MKLCDMNWMEECIKSLREYKLLQKDDSNFGVVCRASFAKGYLSERKEFEQVVALLDAILEPFEQEAC